jgi:HPt (histidine-containing phosphotransfer) domain-containing protein
VAPSPESPSPAPAALQTLRQRFRDGLPARLSQIEQTADAQLRLLAVHRLVGAAGSYGEADLARAARHCEQGLETQAEDAAARLEALLQALRRCMDTV